MDKRRYKRFVVDILEINTRMTFARNVKIYDISVGGIALRVDRQLNLGAEYTLKIEGKGKALSLKGIVIWSLLSESLTDPNGNVIPIYKAGMKFLDCGKEKSSEIADFIKAHMKDLSRQVDVVSMKGTRIHLRFLIEDPEQAILDFREQCRVKKIGFGGMLVESDHHLDVESKYPLEITITEDKSIRLTGRVASCLLVKKKEGERYDIGIEFLDVSERTRGLLSEFIRLLENME
jgi:c-di-GMP-binding flagellar brake protein YcgR